MPYLGASPRNINTRSVIDHQEYLGSQADTSTNSGYYTFYVNYTPGNVSVVIRGVHMASSDYTATNGTDVRISTSTITLANDDVIEIIGYGIPSSQILERSDVNITGGQAVNLTQVGASSYKVGNTEVIDSSGNLISGTLGANVSFANIADDAISGDKIHSGAISSSTLDGIKLKSSGDSITKSDGTTAVLSESAGVVTLNNGTIGSGVVFPAGVVIGMAFLADVTNGTGGASSTSATLRNLNTTIFSINCPVTISANEFSFDEIGTYVIYASAPSYAANRHILRLSDDGGSTFIGVGSAEYTFSSNSVVTRSFLCKNVTVSSSQITGGGFQKDFGLFHIVDVTDANGFGISSEETTTEQFLQVQIFRLA